MADIHPFPNAVAGQQVIKLRTSRFRKEGDGPLAPEPSVGGEARGDFKTHLRRALQATGQPGLRVAHAPEGAGFITKPQRRDLRGAMAVEHGQAHRLPMPLKKGPEGRFIGTGAHFAFRK